MDPKILGPQDSSLIVLAAQTVTNNLTGATFDLAQGATLQNSTFAPGGGGAPMEFVIPVTSYNLTTNEVQTVSITGSPTGGTFAFGWGGQTTSSIAYNATAATLQSDLQALSSIGAGNVTVTGSNPNFVVTFTGTLAQASRALITETSSLTGGTSPAVVIAETQAGGMAGIGDESYTFTVQDSPDGSTWTTRSRAAVVGNSPTAPESGVPNTGGIFNLVTSIAARYVRMIVAVAGTAPSIVLGNIYLNPQTNAYGV